MAAGLVTLTLLDGSGNPFTGRFWSSDGTTAGLLYSPSLVVDTVGAPIDWTAPVPVTQSTSPWVVSGTITANLGTIAGVATAAKQPALGTAGASSTDVLSIQGIASGTNLPVSQATASALNATVVGSGPVSNGAAQAGSQLGAAVYNAATPPTLTTGQQAAFQSGSRGALQVQVMVADGLTTQALLTAGSDGDSNARAGFYNYARPELWNGATWDRQKSIGASFGTATGVTAVEQAGAAFTYIATGTTTQVKSGAGILHKIIINTPIAAATISLIDNTSGSTVNIGLITLTADLKPFSITYDLSFATGLRIITSAATDITVVYR